MDTPKKVRAEDTARPAKPIAADCMCRMNQVRVLSPSPAWSTIVSTPKLSCRPSGSASRPSVRQMKKPVTETGTQTKTPQT